MYTADTYDSRSDRSDHIKKKTTIILQLCYITYSILHIRPLNLVLIKKNQHLHSRSQYWNDNEAAPANGGFVHKANSSKYMPTFFVQAGIANLFIYLF